VPLRRSSAAWVSALPLVLALSACAGPTHSRNDYKLKLANTAESLDSSAQTVLMVADLLEHDRALNPYSASVISDAEDDATSAQQTFDSRQPPDEASDKLRQQADKTLEDVVSAITDARVAARDADLAALRQAASDLKDLISDLQKLEEV
jgi:Na+-transporting NADH:ubiquinone oxidoreductase subunit NqrC